jgi:hypothetical protein
LLITRSRRTPLSLKRSHLLWCGALSLIQALAILRYLLLLLRNKLLLTLLGDTA